MRINGSVQEMASPHALRIAYESAQEMVNGVDQTSCTQPAHHDQSC